MPTFNIKPIGQLVSAIARLGNTLYQSPPNTIRGVDPNNWPTASQPVQPVAPKGSGPLGFPFWQGFNLTYTPRPDAAYTAADLRALSMYPLSRMCIDNAKDQLCQMPWNVQLRKLPGESRGDVSARRKKHETGDEGILKISRFFERPNREHDWSEWLRNILEDMLVADDASVLMLRDKSQQLREMRWVPGDDFTRYIDDNGFTPLPPSPAYAQLWEGIPRVQLTTEQLIYRPRNIVPRPPLISSYLYGCGPTETIADEIKIGISRMSYVLAFYEEGSTGNFIHGIPPGVDPDKIRDAMRFYNSEMAGNNGKRRQYRIFQLFSPDGKADQIHFPKEPVLADAYDDMHIRKIAFAYGNSPQRLQKSMNRASTQVSQSAAQEEGIRPWMDWVKRLADYIIQVHMGMNEHEFVLDPYFEMDETKQQKSDASDVQLGIQTRNEVRRKRGDDPVTDNPYAGQLCTTTPNGTIPLGQVIVSGRPDKGGAEGGDASAQPSASVPKKLLNGHKAAVLVQRGE